MLTVDIVIKPKTFLKISIQFFMIGRLSVSVLQPFGHFIHSLDKVASVVQSQFMMNCVAYFKFE